MPFTYWKGKITSVPVSTVFGLLVQDVGGVSCYKIADSWEDYWRIVENCTSPVQIDHRGAKVFDGEQIHRLTWPPSENW
jgi:hypothetical protein